jgi:hypothetical protein
MLPAFCPQIPPIVPVLPTQPTRKCCAVYNLWFESFHGMEEVVGSIPTRSTKSTLQLSGFKATTNSSLQPKVQPKIRPDYLKQRPM